MNADNNGGGGLAERERREPNPFGPRNDRDLRQRNVVKMAIESMAEPRNFLRALPTWQAIVGHAARAFPEGGYAGVKYDPARGGSAPGKQARENFSAGGQAALETKIKETLSSEAGLAMLSRTGLDGDSGWLIEAVLNEEDGLTEQALWVARNSSELELAQLFAPIIRRAFTAAYRGSICTKSKESQAVTPGSSHRLRALLLVHHTDHEIRDILDKVLSERLYDEVTMATIRQYLDKYRVDLAEPRTLKSLIDDIAALADGYLMRAIAAPEYDQADPTQPSFENYRERFVSSVIHLVASSIQIQD